MDKYIELLSRNRTFIMGVAILSILLFHQGWLHSYFFKFFGFVGHFGVDIFFFVSGFGIVYSLKKNDTLSFYKRRIKRLFPPLIIFGILKYLLAKNVFLFSKYVVDWKTFLGFDLWYICVILFFYFISPILMQIIKKRYNGFLLLLIIVFLIFLGGGYYSLPDTIRWGIVRFPAYLMGMMVAMDKFNISDRFIRYGVLFVLFAFIYRLLRFAGYVNSTDLYTFLILVFGLPSLCYWLSVLAQSFNKYRFSRPFLYCGSRSLELFVAHVFVFFCVKQFAVPGIVGFLLGVSLSLIIAEGLYQSKLKIIALI